MTIILAIALAAAAPPAAAPLPAPAGPDAATLADECRKGVGGDSDATSRCLQVLRAAAEDITGDLSSGSCMSQPDASESELVWVWLDQIRGEKAPSGDGRAAAAAAFVNRWPCGVHVR